MGDEVVPVRVRESGRARSVRLIVHPSATVEIVVPRGTRNGAIEEVLESKRRWLTAKLDAAQARAARPAQLGLDLSGVVWLAGRSLPVDRLSGARSRVELKDGRVCVSGASEAAIAALGRWYRRQARRLILEAADREAARLGAEFNSIGIRDQRTRWGSCSSRGHLSFSWRLVLAPRGVLEYVVVHELVHLREPNHSRSFWRLVEKARPDWRTQAQWLREHGPELHAYDLAVALDVTESGSPRLFTI